MGDDLFGEAPAQPILTGKGSKGGRRPGLHAYPAQPGTGPEGKCCRDCANYTYRDGVAGTYRKCWLMRAVWTGGYGTDIKARSPACSKFEPAPPPGEAQGEV